MREAKAQKSWTMSDEFWEAIKDEISQKQRDPNKEYKHKPGQGRHRLPD